MLSGKPLENGSFTVTYAVRDAARQSDSDTFDINVTAAAVDVAGDANLGYRAGATLRAFEGIGAAVPHGGAPEFTHTSGAGLDGTLPTVGDVYTVAGFVRQKAGSTGSRYVWHADGGARSLRLFATGVLRLRLDGRTLNSASSAIKR